MMDEKPLTARQVAAIKKRQAELAKATASAPKPKGTKPTGLKTLAEAKAEAPVPKAAAAAAKSAPKQLSKLAKVGKFAAKKSVLGTVALTAGPMILGAINNANKNQPKATMMRGNVGRGGQATWVKGEKKATPSKTVKSGAPGAPGATNKSALKSGGKYRVEHGDTLSGIAAKAGVTLAELRAANPQLKGKGIFRNTGVNIPKKGKKPSGGYTGPTPYRPGSAAAKAYEAARAKRK